DVFLISNLTRSAEYILYFMHALNEDNLIPPNFNLSMQKFDKGTIQFTLDLHHFPYALNVLTFLYLMIVSAHVIITLVVVLL
ncbi:hypothetical protein ACJX0J_022107, partial [Zea mays]